MHYYQPRRPNPVATGAYLATSIALIGVGLLGFNRGQKIAGQMGPPVEPSAADCAPFVYDAAQVQAAIEKRLGGGATDAGVIADEVARELYPYGPDGSPTPFASAPSKGTAAACVYEKILNAVYRLAEADAKDEPCAPLVYDAVAVTDAVRALIEDGYSDPESIAGEVSAAFWPDRADGVSQATYPPLADAPNANRCVYGRVEDEVKKQLSELPVEPGPQQGNTISWGTIDPVADRQGYPWNAAVMDVNNYPTPGTFYLAQSGDTGATTVRRLLATALAMAGEDPSFAYSDDPTAKRLRAQMLDLILCAPFNDARVTSTSAEYAGGRDPGTRGPEDDGVTYMMGPHGRGLVWLPRHFDDVTRMAQGLKPKRGVSLSGGVKGSGRNHMLLYFPAINLERLKGPVPIVTTEGMTWKDTGKNTIHAPTVVDLLGFDMGGVSIPGGPGCVPEAGPWA